MIYNIKKIKNGGMTIVEMLVALSIFVIIMLVITDSLISFYRYNAHAMEQATAIDSARRGIYPTINNIREAAYSEEGAYPVISAGPNNFSFYGDIDGDNNVEKIRLFLDGDVFKKGVTEPAGSPLTYSGQPEKIFILSYNVRNADKGVNIFRYYDSSGVEILNTSNVSNISFVKMNVVVNVNPAVGSNDFTLTASATLRNLKANL